VIDLMGQALKFKNSEHERERRNLEEFGLRCGV